LLERSKAVDEDPREEFLSIAIIDRKRVIRQRFRPKGHLDYREVTVWSDEVDRALDHFKALWEHAKDA
jgi:hypothetical protein